MDATTNDKRFRLPRWVGATKRWRMRIGFHLGDDARRVEKLFYWPRPDDNGGTPPPEVQADAVDRQKAWRATAGDWDRLSGQLKIVFPGRDWSLPVWCDDEQARMAAGEVAGIEQAMATFFAEEEARDRAEQEQAVQWVAKHGVARLIDLLRLPTASPEATSPLAQPRARRVAERRESERLTALAELAPATSRAMVTAITVRRAVEAFTGGYESRVGLRTNLAVEETTSETLSRRLYGAFGQSSNPSNPAVRVTPIDIDVPLASLDRSKLTEFAHYWHGGPEGINSERTIKNHLEAARQFFVWCEMQEEYGWTFAPACRRLFSAGDVHREAVPFDPDAILKLVVTGGPRVRAYALFGLTCGYYQSDIAMAAHGERTTSGGDHFIQRLRSKEDRPKRGRRPLKVRHFIAPEFAALIDAEGATNARGTLFNNDAGTALTAAAIHDRWQDVCKRAGVPLMFSQLRKMGYNAIKRLGGKAGPLMAEFWDGHAKGASDSYDDGVWPDMNDAERAWADELRGHRILT